MFLTFRCVDTCRCRETKMLIFAQNLDYKLKDRGFVLIDLKKKLDFING